MSCNSKTRNFRFPYKNWGFRSMISELWGAYFLQDGLLALLVGWGSLLRPAIHGLRAEQEIFNFHCKKQGFRSMAPMLLLGNSQKSCSRLSAVHISSYQPVDVNKAILVLPGKTYGSGSMSASLLRGHFQKSGSRLSAVHISA